MPMSLLEAHAQPGLGKRRANSGNGADTWTIYQLLIEIFPSQSTIKVLGP